MKKELTPRQMINIELATRAANKKSTKVLKRYTPQEEQVDLKVAFNCECADPDCQERILLSLPEYEALHKNFARFVVVRGHQEPAIEKTKKNGKNVAVVEKYAL